MVLLGRQSMTTYCFCDYDHPEFYRVTLPVARCFTRPHPPHICGECFRQINPGERYEKVSAKWGGYVSQVKTCDHCMRMRDLVEETVPCFCWTHGGVRQDIGDILNEEIPGLRFAVLRIEVERRRCAISTGQKSVSTRRQKRKSSI